MMLIDPQKLGQERQVRAAPAKHLRRSARSRLDHDAAILTCVETLSRTASFRTVRGAAGLGLGLKLASTNVLPSER